MDPYNPDEEVERLAPIVPDIEATPGGRSKFTAEQLRLEQAAEKSRGSAMELLGKALNNQPEITPSQGFAAALLGAIPTIGGYMMGRSIGRPNIPQGVYFDGISPSQFNEQFGSSGANAGGAMGAQIGGNAAQGYFNSREEEVKQQIPVLAKQAAIEEDRAKQLDQQAQSMNLHGLEAEEWRERLPLQARKEMQVAEAVQAAAAKRERDQYDYERQNPKPSVHRPTIYDNMTEAQKKAHAEKASGVDAAGNPTKDRVQIAKPIIDDITNSRIIIEQAVSTASKMRQFNSWAELRAASAAAGLDPNLAMADARDLVSRVVKRYSGTAASDKERKHIEGFTTGDETLGPQALANYLDGVARRERVAGAMTLDTAETINDPEARKKFFAAPDKKSDPEYQRILAEKRKAKGLP